MARFGTALVAVLLATTATPALAADDVGLVDIQQGVWHLRDDAGDVATFSYGNPGDLPIAGDWDGDGIATPGLYRQSDGFFYSRNQNSTGVAHASCFAGDAADIPVVGDWDGDGDDNLGIYRPSVQRFFLFTATCANAPMGAAQIEFGFGNPGDKPVAGDWDGDGIDEVGLHRESTGFFYWRNTLNTGIASGEIFFGDPGDRFVSGDWGVVDNIDTPAIFRPSAATFFFRHTLTQGVADSSLPFGSGSFLPVAGEFGDLMGTGGGGGGTNTHAAQLLALTNQARATVCPGYPLPPLVGTPALDAVALAHSTDMVTNNFFSHQSPTTGGADTRLTAAGIAYTFWGENINTQDTVQQIHDTWMSSPGHRGNICETGFGKVGFGVVQTSGQSALPGGLVATQVFTN